MTQFGNYKSSFMQEDKNKKPEQQPKPAGLNSGQKKQLEELSGKKEKALQTNEIVKK